MPKKDYKTLELDPKYLPKKSEEYMSVQQKAYFYNVLMKMHDEVTASLDDVINAINLGKKLESAGTGDDLDNTSFSMEANEKIRENERNNHLLKKIEFALKQLEEGTYGYSILSGDEIGIKRLLARPVATLTIEEQEEVEKREK